MIIRSIFHPPPEAFALGPPVIPSRRESVPGSWYALCSLTGSHLALSLSDFVLASSSVSELNRSRWKSLETFPLALPGCIDVSLCGLAAGGSLESKCKEAQPKMLCLGCWGLGGRAGVPLRVRLSSAGKLHPSLPFLNLFHIFSLSLLYLHFYN